MGITTRGVDEVLRVAPRVCLWRYILSKAASKKAWPVQGAIAGINVAWAWISDGMQGSPLCDVGMMRLKGPSASKQPRLLMGHGSLMTKAALCLQGICELGGGCADGKVCPGRCPTRRGVLT